MKDYELLYKNLFYKKDEPNIKVFDVLIKMEDRFDSINVVVDMNKETKPWEILGNKEFQSMNKDEVSEFIDKLKVTENYYMSDEEYEIIDCDAFKKDDAKWLSIAVAYGDGFFSVVNVKFPNDKETPISFDTDWEYLNNDNIREFIDKAYTFANKQ